MQALPFPAIWNEVGRRLQAYIDGLFITYEHQTDVPVPPCISSPSVFDGGSSSSAPAIGRKVNATLDQAVAVPETAALSVTRRLRALGACLVPESSLQRDSRTGPELIAAAIRRLELRSPLGKDLPGRTVGKPAMEIFCLPHARSVARSVEEAPNVRSSARHRSTAGSGPGACPTATP